MKSRNLRIGEGEQAAVVIVRVNVAQDLLLEVWRTDGEGVTRMRPEHAKALASLLIDYVAWVESGEGDEGPWD